jgi:hypothetical protein
VGYTNDKLSLGTADDTASDMHVDDPMETLLPKEEVSSHEETTTLGDELMLRVEDVVAAVDEDAVTPEATQTFADIESEEMDGQVGRELGEPDVLHGENMSSEEVAHSEEDVGRMSAVQMSDGDVNVQDEGSVQSRVVQEQDGDQLPQAMDVSNAIELSQEVVGTQMTLEQTWHSGAADAASNTTEERIFLRIPKRQRIDDAEYVDDGDREESTETSVKAKKARRSSSGQSRVATWSVGTDEARPGMNGSESAEDDGKDEMEDHPPKSRKTKQTSNGRRRIQSRATVDMEEMEQTPQAWGTGAVEEEIPPQRTSDGWETYETDILCDPCERLGIQCFRFKQAEKGRKRWSCFCCHKCKKQCSFNDRKVSARIPKPSQSGRMTKRSGKTKELEDEGEDVEEMGDIGTPGTGNENHKAREKKKAKAPEKKRRRSSTKPGTMSKQKRKVASPAESEEKMKVEEDNEWQTGMLPISFLCFIIKQLET